MCNIILSILFKYDIAKGSTPPNARNIQVCMSVAKKSVAYTYRGACPWPNTPFSLDTEYITVRFFYCGQNCPYKKGPLNGLG